MDWTYDYYMNDLGTYVVGVNDENENYNAYFTITLKNMVTKFLRKWLSDHDGKRYDGEWVGDAFKEEMKDWFSDFYKDTYCQRPHLPMWYYIHPLGLQMLEDTIRIKDADPIKEAIDSAKRNREFIIEND